MSSNKTLLQARGRPIFQIIFVLVSGLWLTFCINMYEVNQGFFGVTGGIALLVIGFLLFFPTVKKIVFTDTELLVWNTGLIPVFMSTESYPYKDLKKIRYYSEKYGYEDAIVDAAAITTDTYPGSSKPTNMIELKTQEDVYKYIGLGHIPNKRKIRKIIAELNKKGKVGV